jgi:hypothetical protein
MCSGTAVDLRSTAHQSPERLPISSRQRASSSVHHYRYQLPGISTRSLVNKNGPTHIGPSPLPWCRSLRRPLRPPLQFVSRTVRPNCEPPKPPYSPGARSV